MNTILRHLYTCTIVFRYFVYTGFKNVLASCLLYFLILCAELYVLMLQNNYTLSYFYKCVHIISFFNHNAQKDINNKKYMCHERNIMCIINCLLICNCVHVLLCLYVYVYVLCYATFVFQGLHVVLFINKVTCPIYITTLTFGSRNNDKICINISTVNSCLKGTILNVNENFIKWVCNKKFIQFEYIKNNLIRKSEAHKNRVTKCNENQSKEETKNKAPKIINTGKYMINQPVNITYQEAQRRVIIGKYTKNKPVNIIYQEDPQRIIIKCVIILNSNKENSLTTMIIKSINITYLFFKPIIQNES